MIVLVLFLFFSSRRRHTRCALVTGVQTCALPICLATSANWINPGAALKFVFHWRGPRLFFFQEAKMGFDRSGVDALMEITNRPELEIGRASCRERVCQYV